MKIAIVSETSAGDKNGHILSALEGRGHEILNVGMKEKGAEPELTYIHTGLLAAILINSARVDIVVGGCGTGQGFLNSCMQYAGVFCGLILDPTDAWLFRQINGGNCISLALNKGYGWAGEIGLRFIFDRFFSVESGSGYPPHRRESQRHSLELLQKISGKSRRPLDNVVRELADEIIDPVLRYPGVIDFLDVESLEDRRLRAAIRDRLNNG